MASDKTPTDGQTDTASVPWERLRDDDHPEPLVRRVAYVECKLEHPDMEPTATDDSFFPDAMPYQSDSDKRVFYWRSVFDNVPDSQAGVCATPTTLRQVLPESQIRLELVERHGKGSRVVVDGTVGGDSTTAVLRSYSVPDVRVKSVGPERMCLRVNGESYEFYPGTRQVISLPGQPVTVGPDFESETTVTPKLSVRFPGVRTLIHPPTEGGWRAFPSFGLDLDRLSNPLSVPCRHGELDYDVLAAALDVDLSTHPYPKRVLWQAFAYTAFDPHRETEPEIGTTDEGLLLVR